jgi:hypothetical protein
MIRRLQQELPELLSFFVFARHLWRKLRTTNVIERCFVEVPRRTRPMVCFVKLESLDRIIYSIFQRFNLEWENPHPRPNLLKQLDVTQVCSGLTMGRGRCYDRCAGWSSLVARWAHNPKVGGSNPPPATNIFHGASSRKSSGFGTPNFLCSNCRSRLNRRGSRTMRSLLQGFG